jgi:hypothetical protein
MAPSQPAALSQSSTTVRPENDEDFATVGKGGRVMQFTSEGVLKNLQAVQEARGKKVRKFFNSKYRSIQPGSRIPIERNKFAFLKGF